MLIEKQMMVIKPEDLKPELQEKAAYILHECPASKKLIVISEEDYERYKRLLKSSGKAAKEILRKAQEESKANGTSDMTMDEIVADIKEYRREKQGG